MSTLYRVEDTSTSTVLNPPSFAVDIQSLHIFRSGRAILGSDDDLGPGMMEPEASSEHPAAKMLSGLDEERSDGRE